MQNTRNTTPEIVFGKLHKVTGRSAKLVNDKPKTAQITVLFEQQVTRKSGKPSVKCSQTFHVHLGIDGHYHYQWMEEKVEGIDEKGNVKISLVAKDYVVKAGFILTGKVEPEAEIEQIAA